MKFLLDTNILYHWGGLSQGALTPGMLEKLSTNAECFVASPSLYEICVHFKSDHEKIRKVFAPITENRVRIIDIGFLPFSENLHNRVLDEDEFRATLALQDVMEIKVALEARLLLFFLTSFVVICYDSFLEEKKGAQADELERYHKYAVAALNAYSIRYVFDSFVKSLFKGYDEGDPGGAAKAVFEDWLELFFRAWAASEIAAAHNVTLEEVGKFESEIKGHWLTKKLNRLKDREGVFTIFKSQGFEEKFKGKLGGLLSELSKDARFTPDTITFLSDRLSKLLIRRGKQEKNDLLDFLIFYGGSMVDHIVTDDRPFKTAIEKVEAGKALLPEELIALQAL